MVKIPDYTCSKCLRELAPFSRSVRSFAARLSLCCLAPALPGSVPAAPAAVEPAPKIERAVKPRPVRDSRIANCDECGDPAHEAGGSGGVTLCRSCFDEALAAPRTRPIPSKDRLAGLPGPTRVFAAQAPRRRGKCVT